MEEFLRRLAPVWQPHEGQREFLLAMAPIQVLACGRRWGKTDACAVATLSRLFAEKPTRHILVAPTKDQATLLFERVIELGDRLYESEGKEFRPHIRRSPYPKLELGGHVLAARSGHLPRALRGNEATHLVVDEAAYLPDSLIAEVLMPMLAATAGSMTLISTPHGKGLFWRLFRMGALGKEGVWSRHAPTSESPHVSASFLESQRLLLSERAFRVEYMAEFLDAEGQVFRTAAVEACTVPGVARNGGPRHIGVDWARYCDYTAVAVLDGDRSEAGLVHIERFQADSWAETVKRVAALVSKFPGAEVTCDNTGVGDPVVESLRSALPRHTVHGYNFTRPSKSALIDNLVWLFDQGTLRIPPDPQLLRELEHFEAVPTGKGSRLEARGGYHDDLVIALALAGWGLRHRYEPRIRSAGPRASGT
ncbi:MAG: terminase family protein [Fimbriimonadaceae bacterium]